MAKQRRRGRSAWYGRSRITVVLWLVLVVWIVVALADVSRAVTGGSVAALLGGVVAAGALLWLQIRRRRAHRARVASLRDLLALSPPAFERAVATLLQRRGYRRVERIGGAGDLMADIRAVDPSGRSAVVQCKRYAPQKKVSSPEVQAFIGMVRVHHHAQVGLYVTTSSFTDPARALAREHGIMLVDGATLSDWVGGGRGPRRVERRPATAVNGEPVSRTVRRPGASAPTVGRPAGAPLAAELPDDIADAPGDAR